MAAAMVSNRHTTQGCEGRPLWAKIHVRRVYLLYRQPMDIGQRYAMTQPARILIVDDEPDIREMIRFSLEGAGFLTCEADQAETARRQLDEQRPDLVLMDWMLPGRSGMELARELRQNPRTRDLPIIMVTARTAEADLLLALEQAQTDDYITKPFSPREVVARVRTLLRRTRRDDKELLEAGGLRIDHAGRRVTLGDQEVILAPTEYRLLHFLMSHRERAFSRSQLLSRIWGDHAFVEERTVDVHIRRLRKALEPHGRQGLIQTVRGLGYRFSERPT